jgi:hypothetical protein
VAGGALPMSAGTSFHGAQEPERIGVPTAHHGGCPGRGEARDERDVAVEVLRRREAPAPAVDAEGGAGVGRRRCTGGTRPAVHVQLEASWSPGPNDRRPGRIVHDRDGRRDGDSSRLRSPLGVNDCWNYDDFPTRLCALQRLLLTGHDPSSEPGALAAHAGICGGSNRYPYRDSCFSKAVRRETGKE